MRIFLGTVFLSVGLALALPLLRAGTAGSFRGKVVESDATAVDPNWIYVEGRNHAIRRVEISHAHVEYNVKPRYHQPQSETGTVSCQQVPRFA